MVPKGYTGGAIWSSTPAIDPTRGVVYITTGNNYTTPKEVAECQESGKRDCLPIDDHIDSFLALDLKTGAIKWATRVVPFDTWNGNFRQRARAWHLPGIARRRSRLWSRRHAVYRDSRRACTLSSTASCSHREISRSLLVVQPCLIAQLRQGWSGSDVGPSLCPRS